MKSILFRIVMLLFCVAPLTALAQGCPSGQYPVVGQGWHYCADVPGAQDPASTPNQTPPRWINKWLSLSIDSDKGILSTATSTESSAAAEALSLIDCQKKGGTSCEARSTILNGCVAMSVGDQRLATALGATKQDAEHEALQKCSAVDTGCRIYHSECALSERAS